MSTQRHSIALSLQALAMEIDWNRDILGKAAHVETLHAMAKEIAGERASEIYPVSDEGCE